MHPCLRCSFFCIFQKIILLYKYFNICHELNPSCLFSFGVVKELIKLGARIQLCGSTALVLGRDRGRYVVFKLWFHIACLNLERYIRCWFFSYLLLQPLAWFSRSCNWFKRWDIPGISRIGSRRNYRDQWCCLYWQRLWEFRDKVSVSRSWCQKIGSPCMLRLATTIQAS